jgi:2-polyprenyl-3-methyl-5-hydroxy-6-metoxy-1,4-benzoquinol methylase
MKEDLDIHLSAYAGENLYDFDNGILLNWYPKRIIELTEGAKSILELGLGHGYTTNIFAKHFGRHVVLDGSSAVIENFKKKYLDCPAEIVEVFFEEFETSERFDVIVLGFILEHVDTPNVVLTRFRKFLKPNGKMFVTVPNAEALNRRLGFLSGLLSDMHLLSENDYLLGHKRYYTVESLSKEAKDAGYEIERMEGIYLKPFTTRQILSLNLDRKIIDSMCDVGISYPELSCGILAQLK